MSKVKVNAIPILPSVSNPKVVSSHLVSVKFLDAGYLAGDHEHLQYPDNTAWRRPATCPTTLGAFANSALHIYLCRIPPYPTLPRTTGVYRGTVKSTKYVTIILGKNFLKHRDDRCINLGHHRSALDGLNPAHVPHWWVKNPSLGEFSFAIIGGATSKDQKATSL